MRKNQSKTFNRSVFGSRLKEFREELNLNQEEMGRLINRTRVAYTMIEGGKSIPSIDCMMDIVNVLRARGISVSLEYLFGEKKIKSENNALLELQAKYDQLKRELEQCQRISTLQEELLKSKNIIH